MKRFSGFASFIIVLMAILILPSCNNAVYGTMDGYVSAGESCYYEDVTVVASFVDGGENYHYSTTPDSSGHFSFDELYPSVYTVSVIKQGYETATRTDIAVKAGSSINMGTIHLTMKAGYFNGKVTVEGVPQAGILVTVSGNGLSFSARTAEDGTYSIRAAQGAYTDLSFTYPHHNLQETVKLRLTAANPEVTITDHDLSYSHSFKLVEMQESTKTVAGFRKYRCAEAGCSEELIDALPLRTDGARWPASGPRATVWRKASEAIQASQPSQAMQRRWRAATPEASAPTF